MLSCSPHTPRERKRHSLLFQANIRITCSKKQLQKITLTYPVAVINLQPTSFTGRQWGVQTGSSAGEQVIAVCAEEKKKAWAEQERGKVCEGMGPVHWALIGVGVVNSWGCGHMVMGSLKNIKVMLHYSVALHKYLFILHRCNLLWQRRIYLYKETCFFVCMWQKRQHNCFILYKFHCTSHKAVI